MLDFHREDAWKVVPIAGGIAALAYVGFKVYQHKMGGGGCCGGTCSGKCGSGLVNPGIEKDKPTVGTILKHGEMGDSTALCRCWRSSKFPYCDGSHVKHNKETGDNVGPVCIKKEKAA